jgi:hypothetical protein
MTNIRNDESVHHWSCRWAEWNGKYRDDIRRFIKVLYDQRIRGGLESRHTVIHISKGSIYAMMEMILRLVYHFVSTLVYRLFGSEFQSAHPPLTLHRTTPLAMY